MLLVSYLKSLPILRVLRFSPMFSSVRFIVSLEVRVSLLFFIVVLALVSPVHFCMNLRINLPNSTKMPAGIFFLELS